ncbi:unnamed protein product [Anisakis simplex]|uniref:DNA replication licensing factor MCM7 n=1 Tax=Anisakis simplex TaxID=6269 RepID=A0A0M3J731_ANISI|nr:unnamed protein product [Anisakis simplex]
MFTSPRSLLAIIRMSTALARLRLSDTVHIGDIDEAIRLVEVCKASLRPEPKQSRHRVSPVDMAFSVIRDLYHASSQDQHAVPLQDAFNKCASKGIHDDIVQQCIDTYTANGVFMLDRQKRIIFTVS